MSTNTKPQQGRHRAPVDARSAVPSAAVTAMLGGVALLVTLLITWQVT